MTLQEKKDRILEDMGYLLKARDYLLQNKKSLTAQKYISEALFEGMKYYMEIESPLIGGTDADWIRLNYSDVYLFLHDDGTEWYQLDPLGQYNDEIIHEYSYDDFVKALNELTFEDVEWYFDDLDKEEYERN